MTVSAEQRGEQVDQAGASGGADDETDQQILGGVMLHRSNRTVWA